MKGVYNRQGRKSGGNRKTPINLYTHADGKHMLNLSVQCFEGRHKECNGIVQELGFFRGGTVCECSCHAAE